MRETFPTYSIGDFINQPESQSEFEILIIQDMEEPEIEDPHKHYFYAIIWIDDGEGWQTIDYKEYTIKPKSLFFISPGQLHFFEKYKHFIGGTILFTEDFFLLNQQNKDRLFELTFLDNIYSAPQLKLTSESYKEVRSTIDFLIHEHQHSNRSEGIIQSILNVLLLQIQRYIDNQSNHAISKRHTIQYKNFRLLLEQQYRENLSATHYAERLHVTPHHLNVIVKNVTGKTVSEVIKARKILEAKRLLTFKEHTVSEIATLLGYFDLSYFAKVFRQEAGLSPQDFKTIMSEKYRPK